MHQKPISKLISAHNSCVFSVNWLEMWKIEFYLKRNKKKRRNRLNLKNVFLFYFFILLPSTETHPRQRTFQCKPSIAIRGLPRFDPFLIFLPPSLQLQDIYQAEALDEIHNNSLCGAHSWKDFRKIWTINLMIKLQPLNSAQEPVEMWTTCKKTNKQKKRYLWTLIECFGG